MAKGKERKATRPTKVRPKAWLTYQEVAAEILGRLRLELGLSSVTGKQVVPGVSGTTWELDAKGVKEGSDAFVIVEARRYTTSKIKQEAVAGLAWRIQDTGATGALLVSPMGLQEGAQKVAEAANVVGVVLNADATPQQFVLSFLNKLFVGVTGEETKGEVGKLTPAVDVGVTGEETKGEVGKLTPAVENN